MCYRGGDTKYCGAWERGGKRIIIAEKRDTGRLFCVFCRVQRGKSGNGGALRIYKICTALIVPWDMSKLSWRLK